MINIAQSLSSIKVIAVVVKMDYSASFSKFWYPPFVLLVFAKLGSKSESRSNPTLYVAFCPMRNSRFENLMP